MAKPYKVVSMTPTKVKPILNKIGSFLHKVYVNEQKWHFGAENPSKIRIETDSNTGNLLFIDKFTESSHWFVGFNEDMTEVVGTLRLIETGPIELSGYAKESSDKDL